jgi:hypothetical protein
VRKYRESDLDRITVSDGTYPTDDQCEEAAGEYADYVVHSGGRDDLILRSCGQETWPFDDVELGTTAEEPVGLVQTVFFMRHVCHFYIALFDDSSQARAAVEKTKEVQNLRYGRRRQWDSAEPCPGSTCWRDACFGGYCLVAQEGPLYVILSSTSVSDQPALQRQALTVLATAIIAKTPRPSD